MSAASVRPWPCPTCGALAGKPCRSRTKHRVTDTHIARLTTPTTRTPEESPDE